MLVYCLLLIVSLQASMGARKLQRCVALLAVLAASGALLCSAADSSQPTAPAEQPEASSSCRVAFPNTCVCQAGTCAGCEQCAGCPDSLCVAAPDASDAREWLGWQIAHIRTTFRAGLAVLC
jgi:hypothetical protein